MWEMELQQYMRACGYSVRTISSYVEALKRLSRHFGSEPGDITENDLETYLSSMYEKNRSPYTLNQYHMALKLLKIKVFNLPWKPRFPYTKRHKRIPVVLSREAISAILSATKNMKHKLMLALAYGSGLRVSELVNMRVRDIDLEGLCLTITEGKGRKDRISTTRTAQNVMSTSLLRAKIKKNATFHSLRHSFATHLLENGVDIRHIQKLLGHSSITTTQQYTKVTNPNLMNIRSPL